MSFKTGSIFAFQKVAQIIFCLFDFCTKSGTNFAWKGQKFHNLVQITVKCSCICSLSTFDYLDTYVWAKPFN